VCNSFSGREREREREGERGSRKSERESEKKKEIILGELHYETKYQSRAKESRSTFPPGTNILLLTYIRDYYCFH